MINTFGHNTPEVILHPSSFSLRRSFVVWAIVALLWANLPYLIGYAQSTPQNRFDGFFLYEQDGYSYLAKMRQGARGAWDFHLPYTSEDAYQAGGFVYPFYIFLGKFEMVGLNDQFVYHVTRLLSSIFLLIVLARFIARFIPDRRWQLWTWWLLLFSGGWGLLVSYFIDPHYVAYELIAPDGFVFSILYGPPHIIVGFALLLIWIGHTLDTITSRMFLNLREVVLRILIANLLGGLTVLSREAYGAVYAGLFAAYLIALTLCDRRLPWRQAVTLGLSTITAGLYIIYLLIVFRTIPGLEVWYAQNPFATPSLLDFALGFAPLLILAFLGLRHARQSSSFILYPSSFVVAWLVAGPIMAYLPLPISRRLVAGWQIPLCIFGAYALLHLLQSTWPFRRAMTATLLATTLPTTFLVIVGGSALVATQRPPFFQPADQLAALDWLSSHATSQDVVLSDWRFGNLVPTVADARVFVGHPIETAFFQDKLAGVERFYDPATSDSDRRVFVSRWRITLIVAGPDRPIRFDQGTFAPVFRQGDYAIYRVIP